MSSSRSGARRPIRRRRSGWWPVAAWLLAACPGPAEAAPTPCDALGETPAAAPLLDLRRRLDRATDRDAWPGLAREAEALAGRAIGEGARACAHYLAAAGHFFLSDRGPARRRHAAAAVRHLLAAQALAPGAMTGRQPRMRLRTAWSRVGRVAGSGGDRGPVDVTLTPPPRADALRLVPADATAWLEDCGDALGCAGALDIRVPLAAGRATVLSLRPGRWVATVEGRCGAGEARPLDVPPGGASFDLPPPAPCLARLDIAEGESPIPGATVRPVGAASDAPPLDPAAVPARLERVRIEAPGYRPREVALPPDGGAVRVELRRCPVRVEVETTPAGARVEGAAPAPWGPRRLRIEHPGHQPVERRIEVPPPARCAGAAHRLPEPVVLARHVVVVARRADGAPVTPVRLLVDGEPVAITGFARPPGTYAYEAGYADHETVRGRFAVPVCPELPCPPAVLEIAFPGEGGVRRGPLITMSLGGVIIAGGLASGAAALATQGRIDDYTTRAEEGFPIDSLIARRDEQARAANILVAAGTATLLSGLIWHLVTGDPP